MWWSDFYELPYLQNSWVPLLALPFILKSVCEIDRKTNFMWFDMNCKISISNTGQANLSVEKKLTTASWVAGTPTPFWHRWTEYSWIGAISHQQMRFIGYGEWYGIATLEQILGIEKKKSSQAPLTLEVLVLSQYCMNAGDLYHTYKKDKKYNEKSSSFLFFSCLVEEISYILRWSAMGCLSITSKRCVTPRHWTFCPPGTYHSFVHQST